MRILLSHFNERELRLLSAQSAPHDSVFHIANGLLEKAITEMKSQESKPRRRKSARQ